MTRRFDAVIFDLLTALVDSWSAWNRAAGGAEAGHRWRRGYLELTYGSGDYRRYEDLVRESAIASGLDPDAAARLIDDWDRIEPWPEVPAVLARLGDVRIGVATNCSEALGRRAVARLGRPVDVLVTAERAGAYKPDPRPYRLAIRELGLPPERILFVAGSPADLPGAAGVGLTVAWHNRIGLAARAGSPAPLAELTTLEGLPALLLD